VSGSREPRLLIYSQDGFGLGHQRRTTLLAQLESASLALQNVRLDLVKLRDGGIGSSLTDLTNATQEARALSREIGYAIDAAADTRKL